MKDRYSPNRPSFVAGLFWSSLVLIILACQMPFNFAASTPTSPPSPALPMPTVTSTPTLARSVTLTASAVSNEVKEPTSTVLPADTTILTSMPAATQIANPATDAARVEEIMSGGAAYFTLAPMVAEMMLTDAQGRRIGYDLASGEEVNELFWQRYCVNIFSTTA